MAGIAVATLASAWPPVLVSSVGESGWRAGGSASLGSERSRAGTLRVTCDAQSGNPERENWQTVQIKAALKARGDNE